MFQYGSTTYGLYSVKEDPTAVPHDENRAEYMTGVEVYSLQTMRVLARNMTFLMKSIELGKEKYGLPVKEEVVRTHFIR